MIYSIGYQGFRSAEDFIKVLQQYRIELLVGVRSRPVARLNPAFSQGPLSSRLPLAGIAYQWAGEHLGGFGKIEDRALRALADLGVGRVICLMGKYRGRPRNFAFIMHNCTGVPLNAS